MSTYFGNAAFAAQAGMHGISGGIMSEIEGGKFISGLASGAVSSLVGSAVSSTGNIKMKGGGLFKDSPYFAATMYATGGLSGGLSSSIAGGNFWSGMRQGVITTGLNHLMHMAVPKDQDSPAGENGKGSIQTVGFEEGMQILPAKETFLGRLWATLESRVVTDELGILSYKVDADGYIVGLQPMGGLGAMGLIGGGKTLSKVAAKTVGNSMNQLNKLVKTGKAPKSITRFDLGKVKGEVNHVHFDNGAALNINGT